ncbi:MAG: ABC transporter ATP-binding protein [Candidatus Devosia symbiotica]|nr:ABC transporter ATP-binding protein [Candidatus Devosia symbiotica]
MSKPHMVLTDVHRHYRKGDKIVRVLEAANLSIASGELVALVAPSGSGKSTLLHLSGLLESPQSGEVELIGIKTRHLGDRGCTQLRRSIVGYVYQFHHLLPEFTALENVSIPQLIAGKSSAEADKRSMELLDLLAIGARASHRPAELSGGEQQRVAIARAAANHPKIILADEPTGNLDPETSDIVFGALTDLIKNEGAAALIATHNHDLARRSDRIVTLKGGLVIDHTL